MPIQFQKAVKYEAKGRVALIGPAGSGKSFTMLTLARLLAGAGKIAAVDTEQGSLSKYADLFDFDVCPLKSYSPDNFMDALRQAERAGYVVFCVDSLSHFWMGKDGALEFVDMAKKRSQSRDDMSGWKDFRPHERQMIDAMIASPMHVICTMRTKTDYQEVEVNGKKKRIKVGLAPVQRDGLEYEFDLVGLMDDENTFIIDKTRCPALSGRALPKPKAEDFQVFADWLQGAALPAPASTKTETTRPETSKDAGKRENPPSAAAGKTPAAPPTPAPKSSFEQVQVHILNVERKQTKSKPPQEFDAVKVVKPINGGSLLFNFHKSLSAAVNAGIGQECLLMISKGSNYISIEDVLAVGPIDYANGIPVVDSEPTTNYNADPTITDADLPDEMFR